MAIYDLTRDQLRSSVAHVEAPPDLATFWATVLAADAERAAVTPTRTDERPDSPLRTVDTLDVTFAGAHGDPVKAWLHRPAGTADTALPCVVEFVGYGGGRGLIHERTLWAQAGYAHFVMDTRGQGSSWRPGDTADPHGSGPAHPGYLTRGVLDRETFYYRRVFGDAMRAVDVVHALPGVDPSRIAVSGTSQGGGIALAVAALSERVAAVLADVPFLCDIAHAAGLTDTPPYRELAAYLATHRDHAVRAAATLAYFDAAALTPAANAPALFSVALMDSVCPPQTVYAVYNSYGGPKSMEEYPFNDHEGGGPFHQLRELAWLGEVLAAPSGEDTER